MPKIAKVCVNISAKLDQEVFHYYIPPALENKVQIGCRVQVPFGSQTCEGFVLGFLLEEDTYKLKEIKALIDEKPAISQEMVKLALWVSDYYLCSLSRVLEYVLPPYARTQKEEWVKLEEKGTLGETLNTLMLLDPVIGRLVKILRKGPIRVANLRKRFGSKYLETLEDLQSRGFVTFYWKFSPLGKKRVVSYLRVKETKWNEDVAKKLQRAYKQKEVFDYLLKSGPHPKAYICQQFHASNSTLKSLKEKGIIEEFLVEEKRLPPVSEEFTNKKVWTLNSYQKEAIKTITLASNANLHKTFLIHGITGSGKTEVYLAVIKTTLEKGQGAILLVPEIALTPQVIGRFKSILGDQVVVLHSNLSQGERLDAWESLRSGQARVIIGVRSAVFAPVKNLGIIIIDEEHETTYKQSEPDPRYHTREVALKRTQLVNGLLVLGSATPSIESYYRAQLGEYTLIEMPERVTRNPLPQVKIVDLREEFKMGNKSIFSRELSNAITEALDKKEQTILFLNRRGFSTFVLCRECGTPLKCRNCSISLTYHVMPQEMKCHYCNSKTPIPKRCPSCGSSFIRYFGTGTQQVEQEISKFWPEAKVARMDVDTTVTKNAHQNILAAFKKGETDILVGTQMITKGLDFPNVTLVGVIAADISLNLPDYTSGERTFQLLTQVAGRAGRGAKPGRVIIQTYNPDHYSIIAGQSQNFRNFFNQEIAVRRMMEYPPFSCLVRVLVSDYQEKSVIIFLENLTQIIKKDYIDGIEVFGPAQAPIGKIKNRYRWQLILKGQDLDLLREAIINGLQQLEKRETNKTLRVIVDVEPQNIL